MAVLDWVVVAVLAASVLLGLWRGLVYEVLSVMNWLAAFVLAQWLAPRAAALMPLSRAGESIQYAAGFVVVFIAALFAGGLVAWLTKKLVEAVGLRPVDRVLGGVFGMVRGVLAVLAVAVLVHLVKLQGSLWWTESVTAGVATAALRGLKPVVPDRVGAYFPA
ncbi:CvpA family protein [Ramlibacter montanisoli]|uniref:CvpA family protein n=1 Tax=Ramlibacter montanisoli TaxID=2732512 RepID=A0A849KCQ2_9BURK|nr:CvpA family protein [Ramlibacter montanisoli]NNU43947.1 CvpA family protein [Ramlibacter montanisoli]